ncbi:acetamidase/formamidase family protein [Natronosalvus rutilus]|uniref:Acetamidase/formamidase family protein n=1 Tax=Natronosalvus rutilus TaxID=2953753 RepID=A0A9E7NEV9_9EURY|nr:acetamidase/formamidase family protein [Natronosalvus rutilus]UTF55715.1 acetamidase/formamidase family protein [Natronosalvus rutilus]
MTEYTIDYSIPAKDNNVHSKWSQTLDPVVEAKPGDVISFECRDAWNGLIDKDTTAEEVPDALAEREGGMPITGPVAVEGASPGDVLAVEILDVEHDDWGWTSFRPREDEFGLLYEEFEEWGLHYWHLEGGVGEFVDGIEIPLDPFPGTIGLAPADETEQNMGPPHDAGGNMDTKHLTAGTTLYLPVEVEDALLSIGDGHAAQGDGEICGGAIETPITLNVRLDVLPNWDISQPQYLMSDGNSSREDVPTYATMGISDDLMEAARKATLAMVEHLQVARNLSAHDAYILTSVAADLKINEIVDRPNWVVSSHIPEDIFPK